jgi:hypothetical protein
MSKVLAQRAGDAVAPEAPVTITVVESPKLLQPGDFVEIRRYHSYWVVNQFIVSGDECAYGILTQRVDPTSWTVAYSTQESDDVIARDVFFHRPGFVDPSQITAKTFEKVDAFVRRGKTLLMDERDGFVSRLARSQSGEAALPDISLDDATNCVFKTPSENESDHWARRFAAATFMNDSTVAFLSSDCIRGDFIRRDQNEVQFIQKHLHAIRTRSKDYLSFLDKARLVMTNRHAVGSTFSDADKDWIRCLVQFGLDAHRGLANQCPYQFVAGGILTHLFLQPTKADIHQLLVKLGVWRPWDCTLIRGLHHSADTWRASRIESSALKAAEHSARMVCLVL